MTHTEILTEAEAVQAGWVTEVEAAASAHYGKTPLLQLHTYYGNYLVDELFFPYNMFIQAWNGKW